MNLRHSHFHLLFVKRNSFQSLRIILSSLAKGQNTNAGIWHTQGLLSIMALEMEEIASLYRISNCFVAYETFRGTTRDIYSKDKGTLTFSSFPRSWVWRLDERVSFSISALIYEVMNIK